MKQKVKVTEEISVEEKALFEEQFEKDLANAEREFEQGTKNLIEHEFVLDMMKKQLVAYVKAKDIIVEFCKPLEPIFEYETKPEYLEYLKVAQRLKVEQEMFKLEQQSIPSMEKTVAVKIESLANTAERIEKMRGDSE